MKRYLFLLLALIVVFVNSCSNGQKKTYELSANEFLKKTKEMPAAPVIDVRTNAEFIKGHIENAINVDWNSDNFDSQINLLDKTQTVFVYCLSGGRSSAAANKMRSLGFKDVFELNGGLMNWRAANLPETNTKTNTSFTQGMSKLEFDQILNTEKMVLIDFYAEWCGPCQKMKPYLEEISKEMAGMVQVVRIDVDENKDLSNELKIDGLPTLILYKNKKLVWRNEHYITKEDIVKHLK